MGKEARDAYFTELEDWLKKAKIAQNAQALFPYYLSSLSNCLSVAAPTRNATARPTAIAVAVPNNAGGIARLRVARFRILDDTAQASLIATNGGTEARIAPFWKRAVAEIVDIAILLLMKVMFTFVVIQVFDLDLGVDIDLQKAIGEDDISNIFANGFLAFTTDLLLLEILTKVMVCFYEAIWTCMYGATPGKALLNLRIQYVEAVVPLQPNQRMRVQRDSIRALITPATKPSFERSLLRAIAKNLIMTLLFPMCLIMIFFKNNRTAYDIITKTIVVEKETNQAPLRRN